jgi:transcriptional regulator with XRE-family HTH domain
MSQAALACNAEMSPKHLSFLETGRSQPSRQMLLRLASCLRVPLRDRNELLAAAGFAPMFHSSPLDAPALDVVRGHVDLLLATHEPYPALVMNRHWTMVTANRAVARLVAGVEPMLLRPPVNLARLFLHPAGLAPRIVNLAQWRGHIIERLRQQIESSEDTVLTDLLEEIHDYPSPGSDHLTPGMAATPLRLATYGGILAFLNTTTTFAAPFDITVAELTIEAFLPADTGTAAIMRRGAASGEDEAALEEAVA